MQGAGTHGAERLTDQTFWAKVHLGTGSAAVGEIVPARSISQLLKSRTPREGVRGQQEGEEPSEGGGGRRREAHQLAIQPGGEKCTTPGSFKREDAAKGASILVTTKNLGPAGLRSSWEEVKRVMAAGPAIALFQDCIVKKREIAQVKQELAEAFPEYQSFVTANKSHKHPLALISLVLKADQLASFANNKFLDWEVRTELEGRIQVLEVGGANGCWVVNAYSPTAGNYVRQASFYKHVKLLTDTLVPKGRLVLLGGDWNASIHTRVGYARVEGSLGPNIRKADARLLELNDHWIQQNWAWRGTICGKQATWRRQGKAARLDEVFALSQNPGQYCLTQISRGGGCDHAAVVAELWGGVGTKFQRKGKRKAREVLDRRAWEEDIGGWQERVDSLFAEAEQKGGDRDVMTDMALWTKLAWEEAPKRKLVQRPGLRLPREIVRLEAKQRTLQRACDEWDEGGPERPGVGGNYGEYTWRRRAILQGLVRDCCWEWPVTENMNNAWKVAFNTARREGSGTLREKMRAFHKKRMENYRRRCRERMGAPRSGEIQKLLGKGKRIGTALVRQSREESKRHPTGVALRLRAEEDWIRSLGVRPSRVRAAPVIVRRPNGSRWELSWSTQALTVRMSPLTEVGKFVRRLPSGTISCSFTREPSTRLWHETDSLAHEEAFFALNAKAVGSSCPKCGSGKIAPVTTIERGERRILFYCKTCREARSKVAEGGADDWPFESEVFERNRFSGHRVIRSDLNWDDLQLLLNTSKKGKQAGADGVTYEMWKEGPRRMQSTLLEFINSVSGGRDMPDAWKGADTSLLPKKDGKEHVLECNRPVCLEPTLTKFLTRTWTSELSAAMENDGIFHPVQEGNRERRNTRRQTLRLSEVIEHSKAQRKTLYVAYLDFSNFFNSIPIEKTFIILRRLGLPEEDVQVLQNFYKGSWFQVKGDTRSAKIWLRRGMKQGDPLSPLLGAVVAEVISRRLDLLGLGVRVGEALLSHLFFVDDASLLAWDKREMQAMLKVVADTCEWLGIDINLDKTEISAFDYGAGVEADTSMIRLKGRPILRLDPTRSFRYLGIRLPLVGGAEEEKRHVFSETKDAIERLRDHPYGYAQIHWLIGPTIVSKFRYSCPFVDWSPEELDILGNAWARAGKLAHRLPESVAGVHFRAGRGRGGLGILDPVAVLAREVMAVLVQSTRLQDDLRMLTQLGMGREIRKAGCANWAEFIRESKLETTQKTKLDSVYRRLAWAMGEIGSTDLFWPDMGINSRETGLMSFTHERREKDREHDWLPFFKTMRGEGVWRLEEVVTQGQLTVPFRLRHLRREAHAAARALGLAWAGVEQEGGQEERVAGESQPGEDLIGGRVRCPGIDGVWHGGRVALYDRDTLRYRVDLEEGGMVSASRQDILDWWTRGRSGRRERVETFGDQLVQVVDHIITSEERVGLDPSGLSTRWTATTVRYKCKMHTGYSEALCRRAGGRTSNEALAADLVHLNHPVWLGQELWPAWGTVRGGWWVRLLSWRREDRVIWLEYRVMDGSTEHVSGLIGLKELRRHIRDVGAMVETWETERSLGQDQHVGTPLLPALTCYWTDREDQPEEVARRLATAKAGRLAFGEGEGIQGEPYWAPRMTGLQERVEAVSNLELDWEFERTLRTEVRRGGRAYLEGQRQGSVGDTLRRSGPKGPSRGWQIDAARWAWLGDITVATWKEVWTRQEAWEAKGGRTLSWAVTEWLRSEAALDSIFTDLPLATNPAFPSRTNPGPGSYSRPLMMAYEGVALEECLSRAEGAEAWALVVASKDLSKDHLRTLRGMAKLFAVLDQSHRVGYGVKWWQSGERKLVKLKQSIQLWVSKGIDLRPIPRNQDDEIVGHWKPPREHPPHLIRYLMALPGFSYREEGVRVIATDGALRKMEGIRAMGAAAVEEGGSTLGCCRVGGPCSSTRAELVGIWLGISRERRGKLRVLVDSSNCMTRLNRFRRVGFRPPQHKVPDWDVVRAVLSVLREREESVILTKISSHTGDILHGLADGEATQAAGLEWEQALFRADDMERIEIGWGQEYAPWPSSVVSKWNAGAAERYWRRSGRATRAGSFLGAEEVGRALLGEVLTDVKDWVIRDWIRMITPSLLPTELSKKIWGKGGQGACRLQGCSGGPQSLGHLLLHCGNAELAGVKVKTHDRIVQAIQLELEKVKDLENVWGRAAHQVWPEVAWPPGIGTLRPDGVVYSKDRKEIFIVEVARTMDHSSHFHSNRTAEKLRKYERLRRTVAEALVGWDVRVCEFIVGVKGSIPIMRWAWHLSAMGMQAREQKTLISLSMRLSIEGSSDTLKVWRRTGGL